MSNKGIRLSAKHGVNASLGVCFLCGEDSGEIILPGRLPGDEQAPHKGVWHKDPCPKCKEWQKQGVILISVRNGEKGDDPYRTGCFVVLKDAALKRMGITPPELLERILKYRSCFLEDTVWDSLGLPREPA